MFEQPLIEGLVPVADESMQEDKVNDPVPLIGYELGKLATLRDSGVLTHDEFNQQKAQLLNL